eukprot:gene6866-1225_t
MGDQSPATQGPAQAGPAPAAAPPAAGPAFAGYAGPGAPVPWGDLNPSIGAQSLYSPQCSPRYVQPADRNRPSALTQQPLGPPASAPVQNLMLPPLPSVDPGLAQPAPLGLGAMYAVPADPFGQGGISDALQPGCQDEVPPDDDEPVTETRLAAGTAVTPGQPSEHTSVLFQASQARSRRLPAAPATPTPEIPVQEVPGLAEAVNAAVAASKPTSWRYHQLNQYSTQSVLLGDLGHWTCHHCPLRLRPFGLVPMLRVPYPVQADGTAKRRLTLGDPRIRAQVASALEGLPGQAAYGVEHCVSRGAHQVTISDLDRAGLTPNDNTAPLTYLASVIPQVALQPILALDWSPFLPPQSGRPAGASWIPDADPVLVLGKRVPPGLCEAGSSLITLPDGHQCEYIPLIIVTPTMYPTVIPLAGRCAEYTPHTKLDYQTHQ